MRGATIPISSNHLGDRCALGFFGLPRSFSTLVLPSVVLNLLWTNPTCDVFVHFYEVNEETSGRFNPGGRVDSTQVYWLESAVKKLHDLMGKTSGTQDLPSVQLISDNDESFWGKHGKAVEHYLTAVNPDDGNPRYFPYKTTTYDNMTVLNIVKQWHSIQSVFGQIQESPKFYSKVGLFRLDTMFLTPTHLDQLDQAIVDDSQPNVVVAGFARHPVNDRMIYGSAEGVKVWATQRFRLLEQRANANVDPGYCMHSERFMNKSLFPAIEQAGVSINTDTGSCFLRTRANDQLLLSDCYQHGYARGWERREDVLQRVQHILERSCVSIDTTSSGFETIRCVDREAQED
eukprot:Nitzschia sp. Nitz4//scaffold677_size1784//368//1405//NITZ4_009314-RA/size1784-processed-gene-0.0-mRNA-1//-1//CDS//3329556432//2614//frame0